VTAHQDWVPLLTLPPERIARERRDLEAQDAADRRWRRIARSTVAKLAGYLYVAGIYVCAIGHTFTAVNFWLREHH
jgi:hypothetical protein